MQKKLNSILLLDDNRATNFIHKKFFAEVDCAKRVLDFQSGKNALNYLRQKDAPQPDMIFIDINMPIMSAWEFMEEYNDLEGLKPDKTVVILLSTSLSPKDKKKANELALIKEILLKPLSVDAIRHVVQKFFP